MKEEDIQRTATQRIVTASTQGLRMEGFEAKLARVEKALRATKRDLGSSSGILLTGSWFLIGTCATWQLTKNWQSGTADPSKNMSEEPSERWFRPSLIALRLLSDRSWSPPTADRFPFCRRNA